MPDDKSDDMKWHTGPAATRLLVGKVNEVIDEVEKLQQIVFSLNKIVMQQSDEMVKHLDQEGKDGDGKNNLTASRKPRRP